MKQNFNQFEHHFLWISLLLVSVCLSKCDNIFLSIKKSTGNVEKFISTQNYELYLSTQMLMNLCSILPIELESTCTCKIFYKSNQHVNLIINSIKEAVVINWGTPPLVSVSDVPGQGLEFPVWISVWSRWREKSPGKETAGKLEQ